MFPSISVCLGDVMSCNSIDRWTEIDRFVEINLVLKNCHRFSVLQTANSVVISEVLGCLGCVDLL